MLGIDALECMLYMLGAALNHDQLLALLGGLSAASDRYWWTYMKMLVPGVHLPQLHVSVGCIMPLRRTMSTEP